jgi:L-lactate dehydrogenase (cytochrome)
MRLGEILSLVRPTRPEWRPVARRLARSHDIAGLREAARRSSPRPVFDYVDGGADDERSMEGNLDAFRRWRFVPRSLVAVSQVDTSTTILGDAASAPLVLAPTGLTRMMHSAGEPAVAASAARFGLPYTLSTLGTTSIADLASDPHGPLWFQLYVGRDRTRSAQLVDEAAAHGYSTLVIAVDTPVSGRRIRDLRNGLTLPPALNLRSLIDIGVRPGWWLRMLASPGMSFENLRAPGSRTRGLVGARDWFDADVTWDDIRSIRSRWPGSLVLKGPVSPDDARRARDLGVDGLQLSNHGGRQLDRTIATLDLLPLVRDAVGPDLPVIVDSGVRNGADVALAVALGADAAAIGRAYLFGLMAGGEAGVDRALGILTSEFQRTMQLLGMTSVEQLAREGRSLLADGT